MDLNQLDTVSAANEGAKLELRDAQGSPSLKDDGAPVTITLLGKDSDVFVKQQNAVTNRRLAAGTRLKLTSEAIQADGTALLAKCTIGWDGIVVDGESLACTYENALKLYNRFPIIREQVDEFIGERGNFSKASA